MKTLRLALRLLQFVSSLTAMLLLTVSYSYDGVYYGLYTSVSIFVYTISYTAMLYALWCILVVQILHLASPLTLQMEQVVDSVLALFMLIAGGVLAYSDDVAKCSLYSYVHVHCSTVKASVAFTFISMLFFLSSLVLSCSATVRKAVQAGTEAPEAYHVETTAMSPPLSPIGNHDEPTFKVSKSNAMSINE